MKVGLDEKKQGKENWLVDTKLFLGTVFYLSLLIELDPLDPFKFVPARKGEKNKVTYPICDGTRIQDSMMTNY